MYQNVKMIMWVTRMIIDQGRTAEARTRKRRGRRCQRWNGGVSLYEILSIKSKRYEKKIEQGSVIKPTHRKEKAKNS